MKKNVLLIVFSVIILGGCSNNISNSQNDNSSRFEIGFLTSYNFKPESEIPAGGGMMLAENNQIIKQYHIKDNRTNISFDYDFIANQETDDSVDKHILPASISNQDCIGIQAWWWQVCSLQIEVGKSIHDSATLIEALEWKQQLSMSDFHCTLKEITWGIARNQLFKSNQYITVWYDEATINHLLELGNTRWDKWWEYCAFVPQTLTYPYFVFDKKNPNMVLVIITQDGRNGPGYRRWMSSIKW
jgi:hypothetical protein